MKFFRSFLLTLFFTIISSSFAHAFLVQKTNLDTLVNLAGCIYKAEVKSIDQEIDEYESGFLVNYFTVDIKETLKGDCAEGQYVFKQIASKNARVPQCQVGETCLFFMSEPSELTGLTSPVGMGQGLYKIKSIGGIDKVTGNKRILKSLAPASTGLSAATNGNADSYGVFKAAIQSKIKGE